MGVGFYVTGRYQTSVFRRKSPDAWLKEAEHWLRSHTAETLESIRTSADANGQPGLFATLHPCTEEIEIIVSRPGEITISNKTSTAGPGYHMYVCDLLKALGTDLHVRWDPPAADGDTGDETGYLQSGDPAAVEEQMLLWLRAVASNLLGMASNDHKGLMLSMPIEHQYPHDGPLITPLGTRDTAWLHAVKADPRQGIDLFPWWPRGLCPSFYLGRALCRMWQSVRWRAPLTADETALLKSVHADLSKVFRKDATLACPWREWREILGLLQEDVDKDLREEIDRRAAAAGDGPRIGYRRLPVRAELVAGWSLEIPGAMAEQWDKDGVWSAWDGRTTVWFSSFSFTDPPANEGSRASPLDAMDWPAGERSDFDNDKIQLRAVFGEHEEDGERGWRLHGRAGTPGNLAVVDIFLKDASDRDLALDIFKSIQKA